jgi:hypothetical protein
MLRKTNYALLNQYYQLLAFAPQFKLTDNN